MEKRSRFIAKNVVFLIFAYVDAINCIPLNLTGPNVCPRKVTIRSHSVNQTQLIIQCCPDFVNKNGKCQACPAGKYGQYCSLPCMRNYHGVQCKKLCNCIDYKKCDPVLGCVCDTGFTGSKCLNECHQGFYNFSYNYNCSETCLCKNDTFCNQRSGICECRNGISCRNITKEPAPKKQTNTQSVPFIKPANFLVVVMPMLLFTCFLHIKQRKQQFQQRLLNREIVDDQTYQNAIYCEINDDQFKDQTRVNSVGTGNYNSEKKCQQTTEENHRRINIAKSLPNLCMYEEQYLSPYCSLQNADNDYLNPSCALGLGRRVSSCSNLLTITDTIDVAN